TRAPPAGRPAPTIDRHGIGSSRRAGADEALRPVAIALAVIAGLQRIGAEPARAHDLAILHLRRHQAGGRAASLHPGLQRTQHVVPGIKRNAVLAAAAGPPAAFTSRS